MLEFKLTWTEFYVIAHKDSMHEKNIYLKKKKRGGREKKQYKLPCPEEIWTELLDKEHQVKHETWVEEIIAVQ